MSKKNRGYTLVEIVIVITIIGILVAGGAALLGESFKGGFSSTNSINAGWRGRLAFERMSDDIREARTATSADLTPGANSITFNTVNGETITYAIQSGTNNLMRNNQILANDVSALSFTYLTSSNTTTSTAADVRCIVINATISHEETTLALNTAVCPRNYTL